MDNHQILDDLDHPSNGNSKPKEADLLGLGLGNSNPAQVDTIVSVDDGDEGEDLELLLEDERKRSSAMRASSKLEKLEKETPKKLQYRRLMQLARPELWFIVGGTACLILANLALLTIPYYVGEVIDVSTAPNATFTTSQGQLLKSVIIVSGFVFSSSLLGERLVTRLRKDLFNSIVVQEIAFFDETKTGELVNRLSSDCTVLQGAVTDNVSMALRSAFTLIAGIGALFYLSWQLTLVILASLPLIVIAAIIYGRFVKRLSKEFQDGLASAADTSAEAFSLVRTVRSFAKEESEMNKYAKKIDHAYGLAKTRAKGLSAFGGAMSFLANISITGVMYFGGYLVMKGFPNILQITNQLGKLTAGTLTSFAIYALSVAGAVGTVTALYGDLMKAAGSSERVFQLIDRKPNVNWKGGSSPSKINGTMEMKGVHFSYPARADLEVLKGIDLKITPGKVVALVGPSGSGKSTIVALLEAFYYPTKGTILFDGVDIRDVDPQVLRQHIGIVSQEPMLFGTSIAENISYGKPDATIDEIISAAKLSNAHQFISGFPEGYDTIVGERGLRLSGGQKQRVAIARALLMNPSILLLDEATSALDAESEHLVQQALDTLMKGRTVLVIAHRLSTVQNADQVCVVHNGKIIEEGTHSQLLEKQGMYRRLVKRQLQNK